MDRRRTTSRLLWLGALVAAVVVAVWAGTAVRHRLDGPSPVPAVRAATAAYASGDCAALKAVSAEPAEVSCRDVRQVEQAYRDEHLRPSTFTYELAAESDDVATVRISYVRAGKPEVEMVRLLKQRGKWRIAPTVTGIE